MSELLPCPFCGHDDPQVYEEHAHTVSAQWTICCNNPADCDGRVSGYSRESVIAAWNRRTSPPAQAVSVPEGYTLVPTSALRWLFGEEGEFDCPNSRLFRGKVPAYWWRGEFRDRIAAAPSPPPTSDDGTTHAEGCHTWGPRHYECALREVERLRAEVSDALDCKNGIGPTALSMVVERAESAERQLAKLRENTEAAQVKCLVDIRWAVGDKGKLMQDELVEHIKGIVAERDSLRERFERAPVADDFGNNIMQIPPALVGKRVRLLVEPEAQS